MLSSDFSRLADEIGSIEGAADLIHWDVMDGVFVPQLTFGPPVIAALRDVTDKPFDVHLMVSDPHPLLPACLDAGANIISVHAETCHHLHRTVQTIRDGGAVPCVALNPATPVEMIACILDELDMVLVMSVNPGYSGQRFIESALPKIRRLRGMIEERSLNVDIEVDGGVSPHTAPRVVAAGADVLVAGSAVFSASVPPEQAIDALRASVAGATS